MIFLHIFKIPKTKLAHNALNIMQQKSKMKKIARISLLLAVVTLLFASCKSHEKCPAYGQMGNPRHHSEIRG